MNVRLGLWGKLSAEKLMLLNCGVVEDCWESLRLQGDPTSPSWRSVLGVHWKDWCWSWNSNTLATTCEELTHWKRPWCWEGLGAEGDDRGWDGWMASLTQWTRVWAHSSRQWKTGKPDMGSRRVGHNWATEQQDKFSAIPGTQPTVNINYLSSPSPVCFYKIFLLLFFTDLNGNSYSG